MAKTSQIISARRKPKFSTRRVNRCWRCGRVRGYMRDFAMCRICFRELAEQAQFLVSNALAGKSLSIS